MSSWTKLADNRVATSSPATLSACSNLPEATLRYRSSRLPPRFLPPLLPGPRVSLLFLSFSCLIFVNLSTVFHSCPCTPHCSLLVSSLLLLHGPRYLRCTDTYDPLTSMNARPTFFSLPAEQCCTPTTFLLPIWYTIIRKSKGSRF